MVGLGEDRRARLHEPLDRSRGIRRAVALEDPRACLRRHAVGAEQVLDADRDAAERAALVDRERLVLLADPREGVEVIGQRAVAVEAPQLTFVELAGAHPLGRLGRGEAEDVGHPAPGLGTRNPPWALSGALSRTTSRGHDGRGSSARSAFSTSTTWLV